MQLSLFSPDIFGLFLVTIALLGRVAWVIRQNFLGTAEQTGLHVLSLTESLVCIMTCFVIAVASTCGNSPDHWPMACGILISLSVTILTTILV